MNLVLHLRLAGAGLMALALLHALFPRRFGWREELPRLSLFNRQMFLVHVFFIAVILLLFGALTLFRAEELLAGGRLAHAVLLGFVALWSLRLLTQLFVYDTSLWRGHRFNTAVHITFCAFWSYLILIYALALRG